MKYRQRVVKFNVTNFLCYCFFGSQNSTAASVRTTVLVCLTKRILIESSNLTFQSLKSQLFSTKEVY